MFALKRITQTGALFLTLTASVMAQEGVRWQTDLEQASRQAAQSGKLVLVHFWADWCQPCARLDKEVLSNPQVGAALESQYVLVKLNADYFAGTARSYGVDSLPTDVIVTPDGKLVQKLNSPMSATAYVNRMGEIATTHRMQSGQQLAGNVAAPNAHGTQASLPSDTRANPYAPVVASAAPFAGAAMQQAPAAPTVQSTANPYAGAGPATVAAAPYGSPYHAASNQPAAVAAPAGPQMQTNAYAPTAGGDRYGMAAANAPAAPVAQAPSYQPPAQDPYAAAASPASAPAYPPYNASASAAPPAADQYAQAGPAPQVNGDRYSVGNPYAPPAAAQAEAAPAAAPYVQQNPYQPQVAGAMTPPAAAPQQSAQPPVAATAAAPPVAEGAPAADGFSPSLGLDGYCPVTLMEAQRWTAGDKRWGAVHRGRTYLFTGQEQQQRFLANPDLYSPAMSGIDPVAALEQQKEMPGNRRHGVYYRDRIYLFSSEASLARFSQNPEFYAEGIRQAMQQQAAMGQIRR